MVKYDSRHKLNSQALTPNRQYDMATMFIVDKEMLVIRM